MNMKSMSLTRNVVVAYVKHLPISMLFQINAKNVVFALRSARLDVLAAKLVRQRISSILRNVSNVALVRKHVNLVLSSVSELSL